MNYEHRNNNNTCRSRWTEAHQVAPNYQGFIMLDFIEYGTEDAEVFDYGVFDGDGNLVSTFDNGDEIVADKDHR